HGEARELGADAADERVVGRDAGVGLVGLAVLVLAEDGDDVQLIVFPDLVVLGVLARRVDRRAGRGGGERDGVRGRDAATGRARAVVVPHAARVDVVRAEVDAAALVLVGEVFERLEADVLRHTERVARREARLAAPRNRQLRVVGHPRLAALLRGL